MDIMNTSDASYQPDFGELLYLYKAIKDIDEKEHNIRTNKL